MLDVTYPGDERVAQLKSSWDNMLRNMRSTVLMQEPTTLEHIFYRLLKTSDVLHPHVQYYDRMPEDHADRSYRFLNDMVDEAINEERHRKNQEALI